MFWGRENRGGQVSCGGVYKEEASEEITTVDSEMAVKSRMYEIKQRASGVKCEVGEFEVDALRR